MTKNNLPATFVEAEAIETIEHWIDLIAEMLTTDAAHRVLRNHIQELLRRGTLGTMQVIAAAEAGHQDADLALRALATEYISRDERMPTELANYVQRALMQAPVTFPQGHNVADYWLRDIGVAVLVILVMDRWNLPYSRGRKSKKKTPSLSASYLVSVALVRRRTNIGERQVERIFEARNQLARKISASIPQL
jgi:hypothetical protein